jgi:hypothetical protein
VQECFGDRVSVLGLCPCVQGPSHTAVC